MTPRPALLALALLALTGAGSALPVPPRDLQWSPPVPVIPPVNVAPAEGVCDDGQSRIKVELTTDRYPRYTSWEVTTCPTLLHADPAVVGHSPVPDFVFYNSDYEAETDYVHEFCVPAQATASFTFTIRDGQTPNPNGICCEDGEGSYRVSLDGNEVAVGGEFEREEVTVFGGTCPILSCAQNNQRTLRVEFLTRMPGYYLWWDLYEACSADGHLRRPQDEVPPGAFVQQSPPPLQSYYKSPYEDNTQYMHEICISKDPEVEYTFTAYDNDGRGMMGSGSASFTETSRINQDGLYALFIDDVKVAEGNNFGRSEAVSVGGKCPPTPCPDGVVVRVELKTAMYTSNSINWQLKETCDLARDSLPVASSIPYGANQEYSHDICVPRADVALTFTMSSNGEEGMCHTQHAGMTYESRSCGWYRVYLDGVLMKSNMAGDIGSEEVTAMTPGGDEGGGCPAVGAGPERVDLAAARHDFAAAGACWAAADANAGPRGRTVRQCAQACAVLGAAGCHGFMFVWGPPPDRSEGGCTLHKTDPTGACCPDLCGAPSTQSSGDGFTCSHNFYCEGEAKCEGAVPATFNPYVPGVLGTCCTENSQCQNGESLDSWHDGVYYTHTSTPHTVASA